MFSRHLLSRTTAVMVFLAAGCGSEADPSGAGGSPDETDDRTLLQTDKGPVQGALLGQTRAFLGIPYAAPPTGALRWKPPQPVAPWTAPRDATEKGPFCAQFEAPPDKLLAGTSEDCLTLNVWTPAAAADGPLPVMVWLHGGGFFTGSGADPGYDGRALSEATGAVIVTINYRLGVLGWLAHSALSAEDPAHPSSGMYGFEDQRAALEWVRDNIGSFGGDEGNVTLFGQSAGGISIAMHLVSPKSAGLFHRAIIQSGPGSVVSVPESLAQAQGDALAGKLGCTDEATVLSCLRGKKTDEVLLALPSRSPKSSEGANWFPNVDGFNLPEPPMALLAKGRFNNVPTLLGANKDDGSLFAPSLGTEDELLALMEAMFPGQGSTVAAKYSSAAFGSPSAAVSAVFSDAFWICPVRTMARALANAGAETYFYHFVSAPRSTLYAPELGAFHAAEVPFVFTNPFLGITLGEQDEPLSKAMIGYWSSMARGGDPNDGAAFAWPRYDAATDQGIVLDRTLATQAGVRKDFCDFWDTLGQ